MKRIWIVFLTLALLVLAGCGEKEPIAFSGGKESQPPGIETSVDSASPVENTMLQQESTENIANVKEPAEAKTTEYVPAASVTAADEKEELSTKPSSSQPVNEQPYSHPSEAEPEPTAPDPQEPPAPSETPPDPVEEAPEEVPAQEPESEPEPDFDIGYWISYAKGTAAKKGLALDSSAVDCWDNPITANPDCIYLERDIDARLSRYAGDEDITAVWIWYESILKNEYGMETHRTTIKSDIEMLQQAGVGIQAVRSSQNQYNYIERDFDIAELKLLIDAVMSAKFMTKGKSDQLVAKLTALAGANKARELKRNLTVDGRYKMENEQILMTIDAINDAINQRRKIKFQKIEYNVKKEQVLHHGGETYTFSPYSLVWDGDFYYVVGFSDKYQSIGSHRVDRIFQRPEILEEAAVPAPLGFDVNKYINTTFRMYNAPRREVELVCDNGVMDAIIDRFGPDVETYACDQQNFRVIAEIAVGKVFFNWIFGFEGKVKIKAPEDVRQLYKEQVLKAAELI